MGWRRSNATHRPSTLQGLWSGLHEIVRGAPEAEPPTRLKERLLERVRERSGMRIETAASRTWQASGRPGVEIHQLFVDESNARQTMLIRMAAGSHLPEHIHGAAEECYVLDGELIDKDRRLAAGDYLNSADGTRHAVASDTGCLLLVNSSLHDHLLG